MSGIIKDFSCAGSKVMGEQFKRPTSHGAGDGLNYITNGAIPDYNADVIHTILIFSGLALLHPKTRIAGVIGLGIVATLWCIGQHPKAVRPRKEASQCPNH